MLRFSHYNPMFLWCSLGENYHIDFWNPDGEMRVVPPEALNASVQITVLLDKVGWFPVGHLDSPQQPQAHLTLGRQLCSPLWSCCPLTWHCPLALGLALWVNLGRLCVSLKMCCRSRARHKWSLVNLLIFINLTLKSSACCSLKKFSLVSSHPLCCLPFLIAQK